MALSYNGYDTNFITIEKAKGAQINLGDFVTITNHLASKAASGVAFIGVVTDVKGDYLTVKTRGYHECPYTGSTAPKEGMCTLASNGADGVMCPASSSTEVNVPRTVLRIDTANKRIGFII